MNKQEQNDIATRLQSVPAFSTTAAKHRKVIAGLGKILPWREGHEGIKQGSGAAAFYVVLQGTLEVSRDGKVVARLHADDFFGEIALLTGEPRNATVTATADSTLFVLGRPAFAAAVNKHPEIGLQMLEAMAHRRAAVA